jgi:hypothetical protein
MDASASCARPNIILNEKHAGLRINITIRLQRNRKARRIGQHKFTGKDLMSPACSDVLGRFSVAIDFAVRLSLLQFTRERRRRRALP